MLEVAAEWFRTLGCDAPAPPERRPNIESPRAYVLFSNLMVPGMNGIEFGVQSQEDNTAHRSSADFQIHYSCS
jgi:hypothetical protein